MAGRFSGPRVPRMQEDWRSLSRATPVFIDRSRGDITVVIAHFGRIGAFGRPT
jgi:hypothetical protein